MEFIYKGGDDVMLCCPYHKEGRERKPSAGIRKSDGLFHCLACDETHSLPEMISHCFGWHDPFGKHGFKWLVKNFATTEVSEREDIEIDLDRNNTSNKSSVLDNSSYLKLPCITEQELDKYRYTHPYMYERGLTDSVIDLFDIGYEERTDSITFPVRWWGCINNGQCLFVAKRRVNFKRFDLPKNIEKPLYGMYELWHMCEKDFNPPAEVWIVEGLFDCLRLWVNGKPALAGFGCNFSQYQLNLIRNLPCRTIILATDNDEAGRKARLKLRQALPTKLIMEAKIPEGKKDIGELTDEEIRNLEVEL